MSPRPEDEVTHVADIILLTGLGESSGDSGCFRSSIINKTPPEETFGEGDCVDCNNTDEDYNWSMNDRKLKDQQPQQESHDEGEGQQLHRQLKRELKKREFQVHRETECIFYSRKKPQQQQLKLIQRYIDYYDHDHHSENCQRRWPLLTSATTSKSQKHQQRRKPLLHSIPITTSLLALVTIDMFAVSLVVPLLVQYYKKAGIENASQRELLSSVFSFSQIIGGLILGGLADAKLVHHKSILYLSFGGSAAAYALMAFIGNDNDYNNYSDSHKSFFAVRGIWALILSRVLVGLVKQTMTVTTTMLTKCTNKDNRAYYIGRLNASATVAWIIGPSIGAVLYKYIDHRAPLLLACLLFTANIILAAMLLPDNIYDANDSSSTTGSAVWNVREVVDEQQKGEINQLGKGTEKGKTTPRRISFLRNIKSCFSSETLSSVIAAVLIFTWITKATNCNNLGSFYEDMYGLEPHHRGYISSYQQALGFLAQSVLIGPAVRLCGCERRAACCCAIIISIAVLLQYQRSLLQFLFLLCPVMSVTMSIMQLSLQTLVTQVAPVGSIFSVLAALDILQNAVSVSVPFYRTALFSQLAEEASRVTMTTNINTTASVFPAMAIPNQKIPGASFSSGMSGDPEPVVWVLTCTVHWFIAAGAMSFFLHNNENSSCEKILLRKG